MRRLAKLVRWLPARATSRWLLAAVFSAVVVLGATMGVRTAGSEENRLPRARAWSGCAVGAPKPPGQGLSATPADTTLILADASDKKPISQTYATLAANVASHFGPTTVLDSSRYESGMLGRYRAVIYLGVTERPLPSAFLADVQAGLGPVLWLGGNADQLASYGQFEALYGWRPGRLAKPPKVKGIRYKNALLNRDPRETEPIRTYAAVDPARVKVLGTVVTQDGRTFPWALQSRNLTYVGELALANADPEADRTLAVADLMYGVLAPYTPERHRALVRLEDIGPNYDAKALRKVGELLHDEGVPFTFGVYPVYVGPIWERPRRVLRMKDQPRLVRTIHWLMEHGGTMVLHGYTHQTDGMRNPTSGMSADDFEFFRTHFDGKRQLVYDGPIRGDSPEWARGRLKKAVAEMRAAHLPTPQIFELPHYAAAPTDYRVIAQDFRARFDRGTVFAPNWRGREPASPYMFEVFAPFVIRDTYGSVVLPETLGYVTTRPVERRAHAVDMIVSNARVQKVVRDNVAGFFYHPFLGTGHLKSAIDRIRAMGYQFVSPCDL